MNRDVIGIHSLVERILTAFFVSLMHFSVSSHELMFSVIIDTNVSVEVHLPLGNDV